jgi:hypothetical protein
MSSYSVLHFEVDVTRRRDDRNAVKFDHVPECSSVPNDVHYHATIIPH